jgi:hypothetical protein
MREPLMLAPSQRAPADRIAHHRADPAADPLL